MGSASSCRRSRPTRRRPRTPFGCWRAAPASSRATSRRTITAPSPTSVRWPSRRARGARASVARCSRRCSRRSTLAAARRFSWMRPPPARRCTRPSASSQLTRPASSAGTATGANRPTSAIESDALRSAITFDAAILGCDRSPTLRELASERGARLVVDPAGYLLTRRGIVGPWLATSAAAAARLFARARQPTSQLALAYVPRSNVAAVDIATGAGFVLDQTLQHMRRGAPSPMRRAAIFGQASLALG